MLSLRLHIMEVFKPRKATNAAICFPGPKQVPLYSAALRCIDLPPCSYRQLSSPALCCIMWHRHALVLPKFKFPHGKERELIALLESIAGLRG